MRIRAVCLSTGTQVQYRGKPVMTGIFKEPVEGPVELGPLGLAGDKQWDPRYHGGTEKAVYTYAWESYLWWKGEGAELPGANAFGENLTTEGLDESAVRFGDRYRFGTAVLEAASHREPCYKLGLRWKDPAIVKRFARSGRFGLYWRVVEPGVVAAGDPIAAV